MSLWNGITKECDMVNIKDDTKKFSKVFKISI